MTVALYMDVHVKSAVTRGLRTRGVDVLTAQEDGTTRVADSLLMDKATTLGRVLFSQDKHLLAEAHHRQKGGRHFSGLAFAPQRKVTVGKLVDDLELLAKTSDPVDMANRVEYLPL